MPRTARTILGGYVYHVLNRANCRLRLFRKDADYVAFEQVLAEAHERVPLRILGYAVMSNHWHFVVWPRRGRGQEVSDFFRWLGITHAQRWHAHHGTIGTGHVYQGRFKSFPVASDEHLLSVLRYVERNPLRAGLVKRAEEWRWGSLYRRVHGTPEERAFGRRAGEAGAAGSSTSTGRRPRPRSRRFARALRAAGRTAAARGKRRSPGSLGWNTHFAPAAAPVCRLPRGKSRLRGGTVFRDMRKKVCVPFVSRPRACALPALARSGAHRL